MKNLILIIFLIASLNCFAQTEYYSITGVDRLTKEEIDKEVSQIKETYEKIMNKEMYVNLKTRNTEYKKDSIIHFVNIEITDSNVPRGQLSNYIDKKLPQMDLIDLNGKKISLEETNGKPTLINFWFTTCAPCVDEMPVLNNIYDKYKDDYNFIAITFEPKEEVEKFLKKYPYKFLQIIDAKKFTDELGLKTYPANLILDKNGIVKFVMSGIPYVQDANGKTKMGDGKQLIENLAKLK